MNCRLCGHRDQWPAGDLREGVPTLLAEREDMIALLRYVEWAGFVDGNSACPVCSNAPVEGHASDCGLAAFLR